ncbi:hypothetical protein AMJ49_02480 [Parcubacteria bacterium DG_74_2]|nr:MAG: hypothetical protein AMJ49_02480 [Parcubacteria bacterium DG_74_2]
MERDSTWLIMKYQKRKSGAGFTLVEILVVIFIISLLGVITFANYREGGKSIALQRAAYKLAQDIRRVQEKATAAEECPIALCGGPPPVIPARYAITFDIAYPSSYFLFADLNDNGKYETTGDNPDRKIDVINLEEEVRINQVFCGSVSKTDIWISFKSPDPRIEIRHPGECPKNGKIELITNSQTKTVEVNTAGLIEIH